MGGFDDHVAVVGDWMPPSPSPRAFFSSMIGDDVVVQSNSNVGDEDVNGAIFPRHEGQGAAPGNADQNGPSQGGDAGNFNVFGEPKVGTRGGLMDRIAARAGFNAPRLNTESIRPADLSKGSDVRSPYLTIPPGLSPTTLLDSPVFVNNSLVQPSPTTGKFSFALSGINQNSALVTDGTDKDKENEFEDSSSFAFRPNTESSSIMHFNTANKVVNALGFGLQSFPGIKVSVHSDTSLAEPLNFQTFSKSHANSRCGDLTNFVEKSPPMDELHEDVADHGDPDVGGGQADDGYNWRKYGQKQVKGSEFPRSYYKCTHANCPMKKKVERSQEGHITEIIYKGAHNHPKPPLNRRSSLGSSNALGDVQLDSEPNGDLSWPAMQKENLAGAANWPQENLEASSSVPVAREANLQAQNGPHYESGDGVDGSCTFSNDEDDDDQTTHGSASLVYDGEGDESESKRRRIETYTTDMSGAGARAIREPRVVVQTTSEVDILDDGYRWRKYGQKVVKGNPNPRSYYKCTSPGCNVRKHVERASHDLKSVITTYEGKHNHDVPAARNSSHMNTGGGGGAPAPLVSNHIHRPEPSQLHRSVQRPSSLGTFGLPGGRPPQMAAPGNGFGFGISPPGLSSMGMVTAALGHNPGKLPVMPPGHLYFGQPPRLMNDVGFMVPKAEPKLEPVTESGLNSSDDGGGSGSVYQQLMSRMPLGPQM